MMDFSPKQVTIDGVAVTFTPTNPMVNHITIQIGDDATPAHIRTQIAADLQTLLSNSYLLNGEPVIKDNTVTFNTEVAIPDSDISKIGDALEALSNSKILIASKHVQVLHAGSNTLVRVLDENYQPGRPTGEDIQGDKLFAVIANRLRTAHADSGIDTSNAEGTEIVIPTADHTRVSANLKKLATELRGAGALDKAFAELPTGPAISSTSATTTVGNVAPSGTHAVYRCETPGLAKVREEIAKQGTGLDVTE